MQLLSYQIEDAGWLSVSRRALLANDPGTGKTATAIKAIDVAGHDRVLVVCPAIARNVWRRELMKWSRRMWDVHTILKPSDYPKTTHRPEFLIVGYDLFSRKEKGEHSRIYELLAKHYTFDVMICDEAHYLKELTSNRTKEVYGLVKANKAKNVWLLTGTPAPNHYGELYPAFRYVWPSRITNAKSEIMGRQEFENRYCKVNEFQVNGHRVRSITGSQRGAEIKEMLNGVMSRRKFSDVVKDLPAIRIETLPLEMKNIPLLGVAHGINAFLNAKTLDDDALLKQANQMAKDPTVSASRRELGKEKVGLLIDHVSDLLDNDPKKKLVIFAWHHEVLDLALQTYSKWKPVLVDGRTQEAERVKSVDAFQEDPKTRIFIGQVLAAGTAITLTAAHDVLFIESSWVPAENYQAAMRCQRLGQKNGVLALHACAEGTYDERIAEILAAKEEGLAVVFG